MDKSVSFLLRFVSNLDEIISLSIPRASETMTQAQVQTAMQDLIDTNIIVTKNGEPSAIRDATRITRSTVQRLPEVTP